MKEGYGRVLFEYILRDFTSSVFLFFPAISKLIS